MNNEEFERKVEFILNQQARFDANIQRLEEAQARMQENHARMEENHLRLQENHERLQEDHGQLHHSLQELVGLTTDGFKIVIDSFQNLNSKVEALVDAQIRTEAALNRHLIEGHNSA